MDKEIVKRDIEEWLSKLPESERHIPYFVLDRKGVPEAISPNKAIAKLSDPRPVMSFAAASLVRDWGGEAAGGGKVLYGKDALDKGCDIVLEQCRARLKGNGIKMGILSGEVYTPEQILAEIEKGTDFGKEQRKKYELLYEFFLKRL